MKRELRDRIKDETVIAEWCSKCYLRIAPYERKRERNCKPYHEDCYTKVFLADYLRQGNV
jgi:hypothetical protein